MVQASYHQGAGIYGRFAGIQCSGLTIFSFATAFMVNCNEWTNNEMDQLLYYGSLYFEQCCARINVENRYLEIGEVIGMVQIGNRTLNITTVIILDEELTPSNAPNSLQGQMTYAFLIRHFNEFYLSNHLFSAITTNGYTYGIIKQNGLLYFFDSHARNYNGMEESNGKASIRSFNEVNLLVYHLMRLHPNQQRYYEIFFISVFEVDGNNYNRNFLNEGKLLNCLKHTIILIIFV